LKTLRIYIAFNDADIANVGVPYIRNWMEHVINRGVEIVEVKCFMLDDDLFNPVMLPVELLKSNILVELNLYGITIENFELSSLPMLKRYHVHGM
jgi:hypothetical protein